MSPNRVVILLSPLFVALAGAIVTWVAGHFPGHPHLDAAQLTAIFIAGSTFAAAKVALWLKGWQASESRAAVGQSVLPGEDIATRTRKRAPKKS